MQQGSKIHKQELVVVLLFGVKVIGRYILLVKVETLGKCMGLVFAEGDQKMTLHTPFALTILPQW